jgi:glycosyltransferase involved in cell wall biosynthesis
VNTLSSDQHMFVVPAFGDSVWLDRCLESLRRQTAPSPILVTTPTPSPYLGEVARRHGVGIEVNPVSRGIGADWNFALSRATRPWVTLAHQDDWYEPTYVERCLQAARRSRGATLVFAAARETLGPAGEPVQNVGVKRLMCAAVFLGSTAIRARLRKRMLLSLGNPIPCAAVMINRAAVPDFAFSEQLRSNLDWMAWLDLARRKGAFAYVREPLVHRTIHHEAATVVWLDQRAAEDAWVLRRLWPRPVADLLVRLYARGLRQYDPLSAKPR